MEFRFGILGRTRLRIDDHFDDQWGYPKDRGMLAVLLLHPRQAVPFDTMVAWMWPDGEGPKNRAATFYKYADRIKKALSRMDPRPDLRCQDGAYRIEVDRAEIDYFQFRTAVERGRQAGHAGDHEGAYRTLDRALELWTDRPFADLHGDRAANQRLRADTDLWIPAYDALLRELSALGRFDDVLSRLDDLPIEHHAHLPLASHRLNALYALSRHKEAIAYVHQARSLLRSNDELDEADELLRLHDKLRQRTSVRLSAPAHGNDGGANPSDRTTPHTLPPDIADFVGRADLLDALDAKITTPSGEPASTVVIVDGPPGVGKTALTIHWAHRVRHHFPGGELFVNLGGFSDRAKREHVTVVDDFLIALGHPPNNTMSPRAKELLLSRLLAEQRTMVVLDNARDTAHVRDLIQLLSGSVVMITSRQRLRTLAGSTGARRVSVDPMTPTEATELLSTQLGTRHLDHDDVAHLVQRCGGLPVAITVLTGHIATSSTAPLDEFANQLTPRQLIVDLGEHGDGAVNVGALFTQSYRALAEPERRLFRLIGLHPGPDISLGAARACDGRTAQDTTRSLTALVDAHLLERPDSFNRFRQHDLIGEFATLCLESDEPAHLQHTAGRRLLRYYLAAATEAARTAYPSYFPPPQLDDDEADAQPTTFTDSAHARTWFNQERTNLTAAINYAVEHGHHDHTWRLVDPVATFFDRHGYYTDSRAVRELAVASARTTGDREGEMSALIGLGIANMKLGDHTSARRYSDAALRIAEDNEIERGQAAALNQLGRLEQHQGQPAAALQLYQLGLDIARRIDDREALCWTHCRIGEALRAIGQHAEALVHLQEARLLAQRIGEDSAYAGILTELGSTYRELGDYPAAEAHLEKALKTAEAIPYLAATAKASIELAELNNARHHTDIAIDYAQRAVDVCRQTHNMADQARALEVLGSVQYAGGDPQKAVLAWSQAADLYNHAGNLIRAALIRTKIHDLPLERFRPD